MTTIYLLGTFHSTDKSKRALVEIFARYKFKAVLVEGIKDNTKLFDKEPFLLWMVKLWFWFLNKIGSEFTLAFKFAKDNNISVINIDKSLNELIEHFHKPYNNIIFIMFFIFILYINHDLTWLLVSFIAVELIYFSYFLLTTVIQFRDEFFHKRINEIIDGGLYDSILIICGRLHTYYIKKNFEVIDLSDKF